MNKSTKQIGLFTLLALSALPASAASQNASKAAEHSALAAGHSATAGAQVVSAAVATPLVVVGEVGKAAGKTGEKMMKFALDDEPLEISDDTIIADPAPRQHMQTVNDQGAI
ncbi:hypothetical protein [uncultured Gilvimarinus sp.]|uniref:hypothetical protein n=1 Tax=uncultured Gilvimarinus sp. TaxID=1689143 RepID=UPI0030D93A33